MQLEKETYQKFRQMSYMAEVFLQQRSKTTWVKLGDDNTSYFYSVIKHKRFQHAITQLRDKHDEVQHDPTVIANILVEFYQELLGQKKQSRTRAFRRFLLNGRVLSVRRQLQLAQPYGENDVKESMFSINKNKSPSPDGYGSEFFKAT